MEHPDRSTLLLWLEPASEAGEAVVAHLESGCEHCAERLLELQGVDACLAAAARIEREPTSDEGPDDESTENAIEALSNELAAWKVNHLRGQRALGQRGSADQVSRTFRGDGFDATLRISRDRGGGGSIRGRLLLALGSPSTEVFLTQDGDPCGRSCLDSRGRFRVDEVPEGQYELRFFLADQREVVLHGVDVPGSSTRASDPTPAGPTPTP